MRQHFNFKRNDEKPHQGHLKFAAVLFIAWNNADRTHSGYNFLFTWKAAFKNVVIFKAEPSIFIDLSSVFMKNIILICPLR